MKRSYLRLGDRLIGVLRLLAILLEVGLLLREGDAPSTTAESIRKNSVGEIERLDRGMEIV